MEIFIESKRKKLETIRNIHNNSVLIDVTSRGKKPWVKFSPFYPHGNIPVVFSPGYFSASVEGIWQGLKVFETTDIDISKFYLSNMRGIKRTEKKYGKILGHRKGVIGTHLLNYYEARKLIYIPTYLWVLDAFLKAEINELKNINKNSHIVFLDYETNFDEKNLKKPLSHASLIKRFINNDIYAERA